MARILKQLQFDLKIIIVYNKMDILNIKAPILKDDSIDEYEYYEYLPITGTNLNNPGGNIRIDIETQDIYYHPSESYLLLEGRLLKQDVNHAEPSYNAAHDEDMVTLINNGMMYLFKNFRYQLSGNEIESINYPGQTTTMLGLLKYPDDFSKSQGLNQLWYKDTTNNAEDENFGFKVRKWYIFDSQPRGTFCFKIPLKHIFGFCEDYSKVLYGMKQTLTLTRNNDDDAIFRLAEAAVGGNQRHEPGRVVLSKVSWFMPHVTPEDGNKLELYKFIEKKEKFSVGYRMIQSDSITVPRATGFTWRLSSKSTPEVPRFLIVGFQTNKSGSQLVNPAIFDHIDVRNIYVMLGSKKYPNYEHDINFTTNKIARIYGEAAIFRKKFFNMNELVSNPNITPGDFKTSFPLFVFDLSKQSERLKHSVTDIHVKATFGANPNDNTVAYAVLLSDRLINFQSDGNKMSVVY